MKKIYVLQHAEDEHLGIWAEELERWYAPFECVDVWKGKPLPAPENTLAAIAMGGPMNVDEQERHPFLRAEMDYLRRLVRQETPVLGVCLGAQLLAAALGARVGRGLHPEIGYSPVTLTPEGAEDSLLNGFPMELPVFQWHGQGFELPAGAVRLATSEYYPNQAFRCNRAWGFQFHLEVTTQMIDQWASRSEEDLRALPGLTRERIIEQAATQGHMVSICGRQVIRRFWDSIAEV